MSAPPPGTLERGGADEHLPPLLAPEPPRCYAGQPREDGGSRSGAGYAAPPPCQPRPRRATAPGLTPAGSALQRRWHRGQRGGAQPPPPPCWGHGDGAPPSCRAVGSCVPPRHPAGGTGTRWDPPQPSWKGCGVGAPPWWGGGWGYGVAAPPVLPPLLRASVSPLRTARCPEGGWRGGALYRTPPPGAAPFGEGAAPGAPFPFQHPPPPEASRWRGGSQQGRG